MSNPGFVQINGQTYETFAVSDEQSARQLVERLVPGGAPGTTAAIQTLTIQTKQGASCDLRINCGLVWSAAAWPAPSGEPQIW